MTENTPRRVAKRPKPNTPVTVEGVPGGAHYLRMIRGYGVALLDRQLGPYWTYPPEELRALNAAELAAFLRQERILK